MKPSKLGLYFDEFVVGETVEHAFSKAITISSACSR